MNLFQDSIDVSRALKIEEKEERNEDECGWRFSDSTHRLSLEPYMQFSPLESIRISFE